MGNQSIQIDVRVLLRLPDEEYTEFIRIDLGGVGGHG